MHIDGKINTIKSLNGLLLHCKVWLAVQHDTDTIQFCLIVQSVATPFLFNKECTPEHFQLNVARKYDDTILHKKECLSPVLISGSTRKQGY